jgi:hypothetical protein
MHQETDDPATEDAQDGGDGIDRRDERRAVSNVQVARLLEEIGQPGEKKPPDGIGECLGDDERPRLAEPEQPLP